MRVSTQTCTFLLAAIILMLTGCGGGGSSTTTTTGATTTANTTAAITTTATTGGTTAARALPTEVSSALTIPAVIDNYSNPDLPAHFNVAVVQGFDNTPANNSLTDTGATLGRVLFYEKQLSANGTVSCASCHEQANGFTDPDRFSTGFQGALTDRNSMSLANSRFYENGHFFWDERADTLEDQTLIPIQSNVEMGLTLAQAVSNIESQPYYSFLFEETFGDSTVTSQRISLALSQFVRSLMSFQSKYDTGVANNFANFTASENRGRGLFFSGRTNCAACHVNSRNNGNQAVFQPSRAINNGLDGALVNADNGVGGVTNNQNQNGLFKVGSLRNIELTAPYMHDGRFVTLAQVVEHYNSGIQNHPNLDNRLRQGGGAPRRLNLSNQEKQDLVAFMLTLTDDTYLTEEKFSNPFIAP
ncbi:MAG: cytochrome c peroxidase [Thiotrichaceae bacterium]